MFPSRRGTSGQITEEPGRHYQNNEGSSSPRTEWEDMKPPWRKPAFTLLLEQSDIQVIGEGDLKAYEPNVALCFFTTGLACRKSKMKGVERTSGPP